MMLNRNRLSPTAFSGEISCGMTEGMLDVTGIGVGDSPVGGGGSAGPVGEQPAMSAATARDRRGRRVMRERVREADAARLRSGGKPLQRTVGIDVVLGPVVRVEIDRRLPPPRRHRLGPAALPSVSLHGQQGLIRFRISARQSMDP